MIFLTILLNLNVFFTAIDEDYNKSFNECSKYKVKENALKVIKNNEFSNYDKSLMNVFFSPVITRGPYLQVPSPTSIEIRWRTDIATSTYLEITGLSSTFDPNTSIDHKVIVTGLTPSTNYFYKVGYKNGMGAVVILEATIYNLVRTPPSIVDNSKTTYVWAMGDCGSLPTDPDYRQVLVKNAAKNYFDAQHIVPDLWLLLGDNAYDNGTDTDYQNTFFNIYQNDRFMKHTPILPSPGNHDYYPQNGFDKQTLRTIKLNDYYSVFSMPTSAQAGGVASNDKGYYSINHNNIHIISLDSYGFYGPNLDELYENVSPNPTTASVNPQIEWLRNDLNAAALNPNIKWTILFWHHSPYTMGRGHNSDITGAEEYILKGIRENLVPLLDQYKIDMVLCGHSHSYERTKLLKGHYGLSTAFNTEESDSFLPYQAYSNHNSSGKLSLGDCAYIKNPTSTINEGIIYAIAGSAGWISGPISGPHPAMKQVEMNKGGSMVIKIKGDRLDAIWIADDGTIEDDFTIIKSSESTPTITKLIKPSEMPTQSPQLQTLTAPSWAGVSNYILTKPGGSTVSFSGSTINVTIPQIGPFYTISDGAGCKSQQYKFDFSSSCFSGDLSISNLIDSPTPVNVNVFGSITADNIIKQGSRVFYNAGQSLNLIPGSFNAMNNSIFKANIFNPSLECIEPISSSSLLNINNPK